MGRLYDGDCVGGYAIWAPDVILNPYYEWEDGSTGAYMLYCCTSSTWRRSCISYLVSKTIDGTYTYVDTIVYSGFTKTGDPDGNSSRNTKWDNDYLNLTALIEKGSEGGGIDEISDSWFDAAGGWNNLYAPNAIDPNLFFDADGEKLYMSYGFLVRRSFLLELDRTTEKRFIRGVDSTDEVSGILWIATSAFTLRAAIISLARLRTFSTIRRPVTTICMRRTGG